MGVNKSNYPHTIYIPITEEMHKAIKKMAKLKGIPKTTLIRKTISSYLKLEDEENSMDLIQKMVADAVEEKLKPVENRLAKITAKTAMAAVMTMYVEAALLGRHEKDVVNIFREARQKAIAFVQSGIPNTGQLENLAKNAAAKGDD